MISEKEEDASVPRRLSCTTCFDALWFCYSPLHQMQQYYRLGVLDNCSGKWNALVDCLTLKTKRTSVVEAVAWPTCVPACPKHVDVQHVADTATMTNMKYLCYAS